MKGNMLRRMFFRNLLSCLPQFLALTLLCMLASFTFAGMDGTARTVRGTITRYFDENALADFWITVPEVDRGMLERIRGIDGVVDLSSRIVADFEYNGDQNIHLNVIGYEGTMNINRPVILKGEPLSEGDRRGCLMDARFAEAHGIQPGDSIQISYEGEKLRLVIRALVMSPECVYFAESLAPVPDVYGFILINARAVPKLPLNQIVVRVNGENVTAILNDLRNAVPEGQILDRKMHLSTKNIENEARVFEDIRFLFPVLSYAVSTFLVTVILGRFIQNQRVQIGTLQALGYSAGSIRRYYLAYPLLPSLTGSVLGLVLGHRFLPSVYWAGILQQRSLPYRVDCLPSALTWATVGIMVFLSLFAGAYSFSKVEKEKNAALFRPKAPIVGHRIPLERVRPLWNRMNFNQKMVARNLERHRIRSFMMLFAALCCNMLLITSLGLKDTIQTMAHRHYLEAMGWEASVLLRDDVGSAESYKHRIDAVKTECEMTFQVSYLEKNRTWTIPLIVLEDEQTMQKLGEKATLVSLPDDNAAITRKLSKNLNLHLGDSLSVYRMGDTKPITLRIGMIVENIFTQGIYLKQSTWEHLRKGAFVPTSLLISGLGENILDELGRMDEVKRIEWPDKQMNQALEVLNILSAVFLTMEIIALLLEVSISYNMGLLNFLERRREYALLKIQGYHQSELWHVMLAENFLLSVIGIVLGIAPGIFLTDRIIRSCETEMECYYGQPAPVSIAVACLITAVLSILVQLFLSRMVRKMDMVEILKSVE